MSCPTQTWPLSQDQFNALIQKAALAGLILVGDRGTTSLHGCTFDWAYDGLVLAITCTHKPPLFVSCGTIARDLEQLVRV